jgi:hypothetical protein
MPYNQKLADLYNELAEQYPGLSENGLRSLAGIAISDGDYTLDTTGTASRNNSYGRLVDTASLQTSWVTDDLLDALAVVESGNDPNAVSPAGALGVYQIIPETAADPGFGVEPITLREVLDPVRAREFARQYLEGLRKEYPNYTPAEILQAYNAGPGRIEKYKLGLGPPLTEETILYPGKILDQLPGFQDNPYTVSPTDADILETVFRDKVAPDFNDPEVARLINEERVARGLEPYTDMEEMQRAIDANQLLIKARNQQTVSAQREASGVKNADGDWRVKLRLAPQANYLYKASNPGILAPLAVTDGVIFPYTPQIDLQYRSDYNSYQPTHSNYMHYFYKGSNVQTIQVTAEFTAQDTVEAEYLLAVMHFFKSASKMFYGQDAERGSPPPLLYLSGLGEYQFNESPCVIAEFNLNLPSDVNYIRARSRHITGADNLQYQKPLATSATNGNFSSLTRLSTAATRLFGGGTQPLQVGAKPFTPSPGPLGSKGATYVPTKMSMTLNLLPIASRRQVSQDFSLKEYANGNLIKKGMW